MVLVLQRHTLKDRGVRGYITATHSRIAHIHTKAKWQSVSSWGRVGGSLLVLFLQIFSSFEFFKIKSKNIDS